MKRLILVALSAALVALSTPSDACTNLIVGKKASADGSVICTYNCDGFGFSTGMSYSAPGKHEPGEMIAIRGFFPGSETHYIAQVPYTYKVVGLMNEKQVSIMETTWSGRPELRNPEGYLDYFNTGVHYSFIASVAAMLISLLIFILTKQRFPNPGKKEAVVSVEYTAEEKQAMAKEIKQRMYALFAVLGVVVFFWFSFHQNGQSLSMFARDFVNTSKIAPEIWQAVNPFFVIVLTPVIMWLFGWLGKRGKQISTPRKIAYGMGIAAIAYIFLSTFSFKMGYPSSTSFLALDTATQASMKAGPWVLIVMYFFLTVAELFISPLGLSFVSKVAPKSMQGLCQGLWLGATAVGNLFLFLGPKMYNAIPLGWCWGVFACLCLLSMGVMFGMVKWLERVTNS